MNFDLFGSMSPQEAFDHLRGFLEVEKKALQEMEGAAAHAGLTLDFSLSSLPSSLRWFLSMVQIVRVPVPDCEPAWIRDFHKDGLVDFPEASRYIILRSAYYLGECFVRANPGLSWAVGDPEFIQKNMPVVVGFRSGDEMVPMMVCENVFARIHDGRAPESDIDKMVTTWVQLMPRDK